MPDEKLSHRTYAAPFGHFVAGGDTEPPANEVLIGRGGQRAYFIDILLRAGRRGAFLITGHRGVGKSSFVRYCLREYEDEVFDRFLQSNVGRTLFWDRLLILGLAVVGTFLALMLAELTELLTVAISAPEGESSGRILAWLVIAPLAVICAYPVLYAWEVLSAVFQSVGRSPNGRSFGKRVWALASILGFAAFGWLLKPFGAPALSLSRLFCALCALYLWVRCTSFFRPIERRKTTRAWLDHWFFGGGWFLGVSLLLVVVGSDLLPHTAIKPSHLHYWTDLALGALFLGVGASLHGLHQKRATRSGKGKLRREGANWYHLWGGLVTVAALGTLFLLNLRAARVGLSLAVLSFAWYYLSLSFYRSWWQDWWKETGNTKGFEPWFRPRPRQALLLKAAISIILSLQLLHPLLSSLQARAGGLLRKIEWASDAGPRREAVESFPGVLRRLSSFPSGKKFTEMTPGSWQLYPPRALATVRPPDLGSGSAIFRCYGEELGWLLAFFLILLTLYFLEYEWILRPYQAQREEASIDPQGIADREQDFAGFLDQASSRSLARITIPWMLYRAWLPVLTIAVNLGFEKLDHRRVVQAMLVGLRTQYSKTFLAWNSGLANLARLAGLLVLLVFSHLACERWFRLPASSSIPPAKLHREIRAGYENVCAFLPKHQQGPGAAHLLCRLPWGDALLDLLYFDLFKTRVGELYDPGQGRLLFTLLPFAEDSWPGRQELWRLWAQDHPVEFERFLRGDLPRGKTGYPPLLGGGTHFRVYHVLVLLAFLLVGRWLARKLPILPYRQTLRRIEEVLDNLTSSTSTTSRAGRWKPVDWLEGFMVGERVRQVQQDPVDPRTIEFLFLEILQEIQQGALVSPGARSQLLSLPIPEITFVFDELDKLGTRIEAAGEGLTVEPQQAEIQNAERRRSLELHRLLADMKNLLSSAPARFVFVGGRDLHDEWLADLTARQPLLTNIFHAEIYLPSLLTDRRRTEKAPGDRSADLTDNVRAFVLSQLRRSLLLFDRHHLKLSSPSFALSPQAGEPEVFCPTSSKAVAGREEGNAAGILDLLFNLPWNFGLGRPMALARKPELRFRDLAGREVQGHLELGRDFFQFLAYRSLGNPKRLRELLGSFVRPVGRLVGSRGLRENEFCCDHVLVFDDIDRFRFQFLSRIFRHLQFTFDRGFARQDDKMLVSVFYLSDFLMKFHRRAFSWSNLDRAEDMVHIHRAPDLREVLETMVEQWSERFLHPIRNGMYDFRFRGEVAREVEFLSRQSPAEMAAFNFTLDESQALKSIYEVSIRRLKEGDGRDLQDVVAGLGELHEFDQEYETARYYYRKAIGLIDLELRSITGGSPVLEEASPMLQVLGRREVGLENARLYLTWSIARLRLMLQVGMTYELARNQERALIEYENAATLARALVAALLDSDGTLDGSPEAEPSPHKTRLHSLKHLNLVFQPFLAQAWVAEKLEGGIDTSTALAERELWEIRRMLPFVREARIGSPAGPVRVRHSNFALMVAELHNRVGDLYFFKGRQLVSQAMMAQMESAPSDPADPSDPVFARIGFLLRSHYHYAIALHEIRRFIAYRKASSAQKLNPFPQDRFPLRETLAVGQWPDHVFRALGETLNDLAEAMLARVSLFRLCQRLQEKPAAIRGLPPAPAGDRGIDRLVENVTSWLETSSDAPDSDSENPSPFRIRARLDARWYLDAATLGAWFGHWNDGWDVSTHEPRLIEVSAKEAYDDSQRLMAAVSFMQVGATYLEKGGYLEDAAREYLKVTETALAYLWWREMARRLADWQGRGMVDFRPLARLSLILSRRVLAHPVWPYLLQTALTSLQKANQLFGRSRQATESGKYLIGDKIPVAAIVAGCSLGLLASDRPRRNERILRALQELLQGWTGVTFGGGVQDFRELLKDTIVRNSYPMLTRLHGLRLLIDDAIVHVETPTHEQGQHTLDRTLELVELTEQFNSPLHFTPMHLGITCALSYLSVSLGRPELKTESLERLRRIAQRSLLRSEESHTQRRAFYEGISDLYFLYDDFNDRQVHFNHALQMAGSELVSLLRHLVTAPEEELVDSVPLILSSPPHRGTGIRPAAPIGRDEVLEEGI